MAAFGVPQWNGPGKTRAVGDLYKVPAEDSKETNPVLGLEGRNEIELPRKYRDFAVKYLEADEISGAGSAAFWSVHPAVHNVTATQNTDNPFAGPRQWDITGFKDIKCANLFAELNPPAIPGSLGITGKIQAATSLQAPLCDVGTLSANTGLIKNLTVGSDTTYNGSLVVNGGTTLDGGAIHGCTIGSLPIAGVNTQRIDVLPSGIDVTSPTYVTIDSAVACNVAAGITLDLAGGDNIKLNTDEIICRSTGGADYTDLYIGNIHPGQGGTLPLRINDAGTGQGVLLTNGILVRSREMEVEDILHLHTYEQRFPWSSATLYEVDAIVLGSDGREYRCAQANKGLDPLTAAPGWSSGTSHEDGNVVSDVGIYYRATSYISSSTIAPGDDPDNWANLGTDGTFWTFIGSQFRNCITFDGGPVPLGITRPSGATTVCVTQFDPVDGHIVAQGQIFDSVINPPPTPEITGDLNMNGHGILNAALLDFYLPTPSNNYIQWRKGGFEPGCRPWL
jgi:hypothetical protein